MTAKVAAAARWKDITGGPDDRINLAEAALVIAAAEYGELDIAAYIDRLDTMGATLRRRLRQDIGPTESIIALNHFLFEEMGFCGNASDYYDPRNSFLNEVIDRRLGIPITLSVLYIEIGRRIGLPLHGVSFPGHFLVKCIVRDGAIVLDPYYKGASLGLDDLLERLRAARDGLESDTEIVRTALATASNRDILARMLRNLKAIYLQQRAPTKALAAADRIIALDSRAAEEYRDRGQIYLELECFRAALADFRLYLDLNPRAPDAEAIGAKIGELDQVAARLN